MMKSKVTAAEFDSLKDDYKNLVEQLQAKSERCTSLRQNLSRLHSRTVQLEALISQVSTMKRKRPLKRHKVFESSLCCLNLT